MSPDSDVAAHARRVQRDIDTARATERVQFITRPNLYCAACGSRAEQRLFGVIRREVWCAEAGCAQQGKRLNVFDPIIGGEPHA